MLIMNKNFNIFLSTQLQALGCDHDTKSYIIGIFDKYKNISIDYSKDSLTILYADAKYKQDFYTFQNIGDWLFFCNSLFPEHLNKASADYYHSIGRLSYYSCYNLINKQWKLYEQLADNFIVLSEETRTRLKL